MGTKGSSFGEKGVLGIYNSVPEIKYGQYHDVSNQNPNIFTVLKYFEFKSDLLDES